MTMPQKAPTRRYGLIILAILMLLFAAVALYMGTHNFAIRSLGLVAVIASVYLVRMSRVHRPSPAGVTSGQLTDSKATKIPGRLVWTLGLAFLLVPVVSFLYSHHVDASTILTWVIVWGFLVLGILATRIPGRLLRAVGVALLPVVGISYLYLRYDVAHGGYTVWPLYVFVGAVMACVFVWGYLVLRLLK
jgi:hypothetical protein